MTALQYSSNMQNKAPAPMLTCSSPVYCLPIRKKYRSAPPKGSDFLVPVVKIRIGLGLGFCVTSSEDSFDDFDGSLVVLCSI
jgi:hypothetical protein